MRIYLDNCCYNRPYDDQSQLRIALEAEAKLHIQEKVKSGEIELATSYILEYENSNNPHENRKVTIREFAEEYSSIHVSEKNEKNVKEMADKIMLSGIKAMDARHIACAILAKADFFITVDDRVLKYKEEGIRIITPLSYIEMEGNNEHS